MVIKEWARHIIRTRFEYLDEEEIEKAKYRIIEMVGCIIAGANQSGPVRLLKLLKDWDGAIESTVLVYGLKTSAPEAAWANSVMARSRSSGGRDDDSPFSEYRGESTVPTALALAEKLHFGGQALLTALIVGDDISGRVCAASQVVPGMNRDSPEMPNRLGATAVASKLLGLEESQIIQAFGIIAGQAAGGGPSIDDGGHKSIFNQGLAARDGIMAAELAGKRWAKSQSCPMKLDGSLLFQDPGVEILTCELGKTYHAPAALKTFPDYLVFNRGRDYLQGYNAGWPGKVTSIATLPPEKLLEATEIEENFKYKLTLTKSVSDRDSQDVLDMLKNLDRVEDTADLVRLLIN